VFQPEPSIAFVPVIREQVISLVESINQPQISIPGKVSQAVQGYLCGLRNANGTFTIFVGLHLTKSGESVIYLHQKRQLTLEEYREVETEGLHFLESMGFMLDNLNFRNLAPEQQDSALKAVSVFCAPRPKAPAADSLEARSGAETLRLVRFLASF
jgi:hypothetical protein